MADIRHGHPRSFGLLPRAVSEFPEEVQERVREFGFDAAEHVLYEKPCGCPFIAPKGVKLKVDRDNFFCR